MKTGKLNIGSSDENINNRMEKTGRVHCPGRKL